MAIQATSKSETTKKKTVERNEIHRLRVKDAYGIDDMFDPVHYDETIDTTNITQEQVIDELIRLIDKHTAG